MKTPLFIKALMTLAAATVVSHAPALTFQLSQEFSGGQAPFGPPPWLTATFTQNGADHVTLTLSASGLSGSENVKEWDFNVTSTFEGNLMFTSEVKTGTFTSPTIQQQIQDNYKADGDGYFDIEFDFATRQQVNRFTSGDQDTWDISGNGLTVNDFNLFSAPGNGNAPGPFTTAAHVQQTTGAGSGGSGWIAPVPEPASWALLLLGGGLMLGRIARRKS